MMPIAQLGEPVLRNPARSIDNILDPDVSRLIQELIDTAIANQGVGIAAPQISRPYRIFIVASHKCDRYPHAPTMAPTPMINPRILSHGNDMVKDWEGCLSVPNVRGLVPRYDRLEVEYTTKHGKTKQEILTGFIARIFQHELDHLDGIVFTDRITNPDDLYSEAEYRQFMSSIE